MADLVKNFEGTIEPGSLEAEMISQLDPDKLPGHVAIIMDGNGRWARQRGLARVQGHKAGIESVKATVEFSARLGIPCLTLYAFSAENWKRPASEVNTLWSLLREYLQKEMHTLQEHQIRFRAIGRLRELPDSVQESLYTAENLTRQNDRMFLTIALNYSGRLEIVDAVNRWLEERGGEITEKDIEARLYTAGLPDPDLLVRSSGEMRISNFLLWQIAYSEIYVSEVLWPDFRGMDLIKALLDYQQRERRYGGILSHPVQSAR
ncbi:MAG TPA: polyprenyl diphosphate synthase [Acidobacteriota bacterium]|nr:polyprenyl diphosphate synthase [Acidobacteriota bacterium]